jgi:hypothetical protein
VSGAAYEAEHLGDVHDVPVIVVEHDMSVVAGAEWLIDLGWSGRNAGGRIVAAGTPREVARAEVQCYGAVSGTRTGRDAATVVLQPFQLTLLAVELTSAAGHIP